MKRIADLTPWAVVFGVFIWALILVSEWVGTAYAQPRIHGCLQIAPASICSSRMDGTNPKLAGSQSWNGWNAFRYNGTKKDSGWGWWSKAETSSSSKNADSLNHVQGADYARLSTANDFTYSYPNPIQWGAGYLYGGFNVGIGGNGNGANATFKTASADNVNYPCGLGITGAVPGYPWTTVNLNAYGLYDAGWNSKLILSSTNGTTITPDLWLYSGRDSGLTAKRDTIISKWDSISTRLAATHSVNWGGYTGAGWDSTWHRWGRRDSVDSLEAKTYFKAPYLAATGSPVMATNGEVKVNQSGLFWQGNGGTNQAMPMGGWANGTATVTVSGPGSAATACTLDNALISTNSIIPPPTLLSDPGVNVGYPYCTLSAGRAIFTWPVKFISTTNVYWVLLK